jgi:D-inositol-3-phosphate glycosyltransferase
VRDGETGYLVAPKDSAALAERLAHMFAHPKLMSALSRQAVERASALFTWEGVARAMAGVYERVILAGDPTRQGLAEELGAVDKAFDAAVETIAHSRVLLRTSVVAAAERIADCLAAGGKVLACGNGGSAADAQHLVAEFVGRFREERVAVSAMALTADSAVVTAWANDRGFEEIFARQIEGLGDEGDVLIAISSSGQSKNIVRALREARRRGLSTIGLLGRHGGEAKHHSDVPVIVPSSDTPRIQEVHGVLVHALCELVEDKLTSHHLIRPADVVEKREEGGRPPLATTSIEPPARADYGL